MRRVDPFPPEPLGEDLGMDQPTRNDSYRQLRIFIGPSPIDQTATLWVSARTSRRGVHRDHLLLRRYVDLDCPMGDVESTLRAASRVLFDAAAEMGRLGRSPRSPLEGATGESHADVRRRGITIEDVSVDLPSG